MTERKTRLPGWRAILVRDETFLRLQSIQASTIDPHLDLRYLGEEWKVSSARDVADGYRFLTNIVSAAIDFYMESDPERPHFTRIVSPTRRFGGDNPDATYFYAPIRGDRAYRIRGRIQREVYLSYTIHGGTPEGGPARVVRHHL